MSPVPRVLLPLVSPVSPLFPCVSLCPLCFLVTLCVPCLLVSPCVPCVFCVPLCPLSPVFLVPSIVSCVPQSRLCPLCPLCLLFPLCPLFYFLKKEIFGGVALVSYMAGKLWWVSLLSYDNMRVFLHAQEVKGCDFFGNKNQNTMFCLTCLENNLFNL